MTHKTKPYKGRRNRENKADLLLIAILIVFIVIVAAIFPPRAQAAYIPTAPSYIVYIAASEEIDMIAKSMYGESRGIESVTEQAGVGWNILNRVGVSGFRDTIKGVITQPDQYHGYSPYHPMIDDYGRDLRALAVDVVNRWICEQFGDQDVGRVLPKEYLWFSGKSGHNVFRTEYRGDCERWGWSLPSPYES